MDKRDEIKQLQDQIEKIERHFLGFDVDYLRTKSRIFTMYRTPNDHNWEKKQRDVRFWFREIDYRDLARFSWGYLFQTIGNPGGILSISRWAPIDNEDEIRKKIDQIKRVGYKSSFFSLKPTKAEYEESLQKLEDTLSRNSEFSQYMYKLLSLSENYKFELRPLDVKLVKLRKEISKEERKNRLNAKLSKAAAADNKIRSQVSNFKNKIQKTAECPYCLKKLGNSIALDHVYPVSKGGLNIEENLVYCCKSCNSKKSDKSLRTFCIEQNFDYSSVTDRLAKLGKHV